MVRIFFMIVFLALPSVFLLDCDSQPQDTEENGDNDTYDVDLLGVPKFVNVNYIELYKIHQISKFRSSVGHDYSDDFESCRSMKHYFQPKGNINWSSVQIFCPVSGTISAIDEEWAGYQLRIQSDEYPAFYFILFHLNLSPMLGVGDHVTAGQKLGTHFGSQTMSDIAVGVNTPSGWKLVSYFDAVTDGVFQNYKNRGMNSRNQIIISEPERNSDPLYCNGEEFIDPGNLPNWFVLN